MFISSHKIEILVDTPMISFILHFALLLWLQCVDLNVMKSKHKNDPTNTTATTTTSSSVLLLVPVPAIVIRTRVRTDGLTIERL